MPDPAAVAGKRILTRESLSWMEAQTPSTPAMDHRIDDAGLRAEVAQLSKDEHRARIDGLRADFKDRSDKGRRDFGTAHDYRAKDRDQERSR